MLDVVSDYCSLGWLPIPLVPCSKKPAQRYVHLNDCKPPFPREHYCAAWAQRPDLGVALLLKPSGLLVIDCDSLPAFEEALRQSPPTVCVVTRKGAHLYYRNPTDAHTRAIHRGDSGTIDILSNGFVVAPPSIHESGHQYRWQLAGAAKGLPDAPEWALRAAEAARRAEAPPVSPEAAAALFSTSAAPVDWMRVRAVNPRVHAFLLRGSDPGADRSRDLWVTINTLVRLGYSDAQIMQTIWGSAGGEKPRQKGLHWLAGEVQRARMELQP